MADHRPVRYKVRLYSIAVFYLAWGTNLLLTTFTNLSFEWHFRAMSADVWGAVFLALGSALGVGTYLSKGKKGRLVNRVAGICVAVAVVWTLGFLVGWIDTGGGTGAGMAGAITWAFISVKMFITASTPSVDAIGETFKELKGVNISKD